VRQTARVQELRDRVAVVTGAASGIGLGIAVAFASEGMQVMLADVDESRLHEEVERLRANGADVDSNVCDVGDPAAVDALADAALSRFGTVHVVCSNAGIVRPGRTWELPLEDWNAVLRVNLLGVLHGVRTFVPLILASGHDGHVVNVASMAAVVPVPGIGPYNVAKHGVLALSEALHAELRAAAAPIGVSVVMPGRVRTRLGQPPGSPEGAPASPPEPGVIEPSDVARHVVDAVRTDRLYVFTHPERIGDVEARFARILG
jgi:NAD(P)-dependent dehydrogenase (short-subunit alcohol dehydrogenase family)